METTAPVITSGRDATRHAEASTMLTPRFYTTDFEAMNRMDVSLVRTEWDALMKEFEGDNNFDHFKRTPEFASEIRELPDALQREFLDFLISSVTSEFSGCLLYKEIEKNVTNPDIKTVMGFMARDESRHAGFINMALKDFGVAVDLGFLKRQKKYTYFRPKFIYYATYISEKIGYARYITIYRHLEANPDQRFHPIFKWFREWCNDEFSHGEAFALLMKTDPTLTTSFKNKLFIRFFLTAVYSTMWVRDHARPEFHKALGVDIEWYDQEVFRKTSTIARQIFPIEIDIDHPRWLPNLRRMNAAFLAIAAAKKQGGVAGKLKGWGAGAKAGLAFVSLYLIPVKKQELPLSVRLEPTY